MDPWVVLKKQYLDDKSSGKLAPPSGLPGASAGGAVGAGDAGVVLNLSAFQRPVVPSAYPNVMGGGPMGLGGALSSAHNSLHNNSVPPAIVPSGYGPHSSGLPPSSGAGNNAAVAAATATSTGGAKKLPVGASLSGQGWYSQTAGRAVNQVKLVLFGTEICVNI